MFAEMKVYDLYEEATKFSGTIYTNSWKTLSKTSLLSTIRSYAADPCRGPRWRYYRAKLNLFLIKRRHAGSPLGFGAGTETATSDVVVLYPEPVESGRSPLNNLRNHHDKFSAT